MITWYSNIDIFIDAGTVGKLLFHDVSYSAKFWQTLYNYFATERISKTAASPYHNRSIFENKLKLWFGDKAVIGRRSVTLHLRRISVSIRLYNGDAMYQVLSIVMHKFRSCSVQFHIAISMKYSIGKKALPYLARWPLWFKVQSRSLNLLLHPKLLLLFSERSVAGLSLFSKKKVAALTGCTSFMSNWVLVATILNFNWRIEYSYRLQIIWHIHQLYSEPIPVTNIWRHCPKIKISFSFSQLLFIHFWFSLSWQC